MKSTTNWTVLAVSAVFVAVSVAYTVPKVSNAVMTHRDGTRIVDITYDLSDEAAVVTLSIETNGVAIPDSAVTRLTGDVSTVIQPGTGNWPETGTLVLSSSFMGRMRNKTGLAGFDLRCGSRLKRSYGIRCWVCQLGLCCPSRT